MWCVWPALGVVWLCVCAWRTFWLVTRHFSLKSPTNFVVAALFPLPLSLSLFPSLSPSLSLSHTLKNHVFFYKQSGHKGSIQRTRVEPIVWGISNKTCNTFFMWKLVGEKGYREGIYINNIRYIYTYLYRLQLRVRAHALFMFFSCCYSICPALASAVAG